MARVPDFYSVNVASRPAANRRYHNDRDCGPASEIPPGERRPGRGGYSLCQDCQRIGR
jgi:hypothetical protein